MFFVWGGFTQCLVKIWVLLFNMKVKLWPLIDSLQREIDQPKLQLIKVNSVQEACAKCFVIHLLKFEILKNTWKNKTKNIYWWKTEKSGSDVLCFIFVMWFAIFQILICEPQSIMRKLLILSWLYNKSYILLKLCSILWNCLKQNKMHLLFYSN